MLSCLGFTTRWLMPVQPPSANDAMNRNSHAAGTRMPRPARCGHLKIGTDSCFRHEPPTGTPNVKPPVTGTADLIGSAVIRNAPAGAAGTETRPQLPSPDVGNFVSNLSGRQGLRTGSPGGIAFRNGRTRPADLAVRAALVSRCIHGQCLEQFRAEP